MENQKRRYSGVLLSISSLPNDQGIGTLGKCAYNFVDFLYKAGQSYWQILPIGPTGFGDSPYASFSCYAGNPYFIDLQYLNYSGYLRKNDYAYIDWQSDFDHVNYKRLFDVRFTILKKAVTRFKNKIPYDYGEFCMSNAYWLDEYALYMSLKEYFRYVSWLEWPVEYRDIYNAKVEEFKFSHEDDIETWKVIQYLFYKQYMDFKTYANNHGISIIGDVPIYVALDSVECWAHKELFQLDEYYHPTVVAGCPPDGFSVTGQLWGNPIYDWDYLKQTNYNWWIKRLSFASKCYDVIRLDHFRGFSAYYQIDAKTMDAMHGKWVKGCGKEFFDAITKALPNQQFIAEDLGYLEDDVMDLLHYCGFPGMKLLQFAFDRREPSHDLYYPHGYPYNCVAYCGTHDNSTIMGWLKSCDKQDIKEAKKYMLYHGKAQFNWHMIGVLMMSHAKLTIVNVQDLLGLDDSARMNTPSTCGSNWTWRVTKQQLNAKVCSQLKELTVRYDRFNQIK